MRLQAGHSISSYSSAPIPITIFSGRSPQIQANNGAARSTAGAQGVLDVEFLGIQSVCLRLVSAPGSAVSFSVMALRAQAQLLINGAIGDAVAAFLPVLAECRGFGAAGGGAEEVIRSGDVCHGLSRFG